MTFLGNNFPRVQGLPLQRPLRPGNVLYYIPYGYYLFSAIIVCT
jgi:hypothetical protein